MCVCNSERLAKKYSKILSSIATATAKSTIITLASAAGSAVGATNAFGCTIHTQIFAKQALLQLQLILTHTYQHTCVRVCVYVLRLACLCVDVKKPVRRKGQLATLPLCHTKVVLLLLSLSYFVAQTLIAVDLLNTVRVCICLFLLT